MEFGKIRNRQKTRAVPFDPDYPVITNIDPNYLRYTRNMDLRRARKQPPDPQYGYKAYDPEESPDPFRKFKVGLRDKDNLKKGYLYTAILNKAYYKNDPKIPKKDPEISPHHNLPNNLDRVYGVFKGLPIQGPAPWQCYYKDWMSVGQLSQTASDTLTQEETDFLRKYGLELGNKLGSGAFGVVYQCQWTIFDYLKGIPKKRELACKLMSLSQFKSQSHASPEKLVEKMVREVDVLSGLSHPNLVNCESVLKIHHPETGFPIIKILIFMELCEGSLEQIIETSVGHKMSEDEAKEAMKQICAGLEYLHNNNVIHFDLKPGNVLFVMDKKTTGQRIYKLCDFGLAQKFDTDDAQTDRAGGTDEYMALEVKLNLQFSPKRADIYSLGCTLAAMVIGPDWHSFIANLKYSTWPLPSQDAYDIRAIRKLTLDVVELMKRMTSDEPMERPLIGEVRTDKWFQ